ncbi:DEAD/DEAH box helicase [Aestuariirhabdus litorea]|uniref:DEAD-box ATP-dependent RNA helicase RhpA n=1 Tax=Aestuariirhabdus litorea TaxID=2528527 RepID=A0A3P3VX94_9GAMM|nr:DEAD/DEAH box helicase [Aestuariirhabdus litorea]RRJ85313.1 DEAD/DEAH box helicase [Aestuariirhabdus litorea]RWW98535.1 DEAD/DEAH box helicase [Endozoicomonadaceae bacterium GTF-13]
MNAFTSLGLSGPLVEALNDQGYQTPTPVQRKAIPPILRGRDLLAAAQTGTGKTAGFALPILQRLAETTPARAGVRALVLAPTRELAAQVAERVAAYGNHLSLRSTVVYGGVDMAPQVAQLQQGVDILVATPGRLLDLLHKGALTLESVETLVLDEADRMLDLGFIDAVQRIIAQLPARRQNLLFSATFAPAVMELANGLLVDPVRVEVSPANSAAELVQQSVYEVDWEDKPDTVRYLIEEGRWSRALVFIRTKKSADDLVDYLRQEGIAAAAIHSNKSQILRTRTLDAFKRGEVQVLVATDIAARGLDIAELPLVINYDLPRVAQDYVHRIGRSGRAGAEGRAMTLFSRSERKWLEGIEQLLKRPLSPEPLPFYEDGVEQPLDLSTASHLGMADSGAIKTVVKKSFKQKRNAPRKPGAATARVATRKPRTASGAGRKAAAKASPGGAAKPARGSGGKAASGAKAEPKGGSRAKKLRPSPWGHS